jgi:hypothetical protein
MAKSKSKVAKREVAAPAPAPEVIDILRKVDRWRSITDDEKRALLASVRIILSTWEANADPKEIAALLGLSKRRRAVRNARK